MSLFYYCSKHRTNRDNYHFCYNYTARKTFGWTGTEEIRIDHHSTWADIICISYYKFPKWIYKSEIGYYLPWWTNNRCKLFKDVKNVYHVELMR